MIRQSAVSQLPKWYLQSPTDYATDILITEYGDLAYLPMNMGAYRIHQGGIWQGRTDLQNQIELFHRYNLLYGAPELAGRYADTIEGMIRWKIKEIRAIAAREGSTHEVDDIIRRGLACQIEV